MYQTLTTAGINDNFPNPTVLIINSSKNNNASISQTFYCEPGNYNLNFFACGAQGSGTEYTNDIRVLIDGNIIQDLSTNRIRLDYWGIYNTNFIITTIGYHTLTLIGTGQTLNPSRS